MNYEEIEVYGRVAFAVMVVFLLLEVVRNLMAIRETTREAYNILRGVGDGRRSTGRGETAEMG